MFKLRNLIIFLGLNDCSCFVSRNSATSHYRKTKSILKSIEIDNDHPSFIAKQLFQEFHKYGLSQSYDDFVKQVQNKQIEFRKTRFKQQNE